MPAAVRSSFRRRISNCLNANFAAQCTSCSSYEPITLRWLRSSCKTSTAACRLIQPARNSDSTHENWRALRCRRKLFIALRRRTPRDTGVTPAPQHQTPQARSARITTPASIWRDLVAYRAILLPLVLSSIAICLLFTLWAPVTASVLVRNSQLRLSAIDNAGMVEIHWNTRLSASERLKSATLVVEDGDLSREVRLSPAELRSGAAAYAPIASHVRFTLVLSFSDSLTVTQSTDWVEKPSMRSHTATATALDKA